MSFNHDIRIVYVRRPQVHTDSVLSSEENIQRYGNKISSLWMRIEWSDFWGTDIIIVESSH